MYSTVGENKCKCGRIHLFERFAMFLILRLYFQLDHINYSELFISGLRAAVCLFFAKFRQTRTCWNVLRCGEFLQQVLGEVAM